MTPLLFISYYFPPRGGSGVQRSAKFCKYLRLDGYQPHVITADLDDIRATRDESLLDELGNPPVYRVPGREGFAKKLGEMKLGALTTFFLRPDAQILWKKAAVAKGLEVARESGARAIYTTVQPWSAAVVGLELKKRLGLPWVLDFRDPWVGSTSLVWPTKAHHLRDARLEAECLAEADAILVVSPGMQAMYRHRYPQHADKVHVVPNGFDSEDFEGLPPVEPTKEFRLGFAGRLYSVQKPEERDRGLKRLAFRNCGLDYSTHSARYLIEALAKLTEREPELAKTIHFDLAGNVPADNQAYAQQLGVADRVHFHGMLPHSEAIQLVSRADCLFLPMRRETDGRRSYNISGKVFEYLAQRKPILAAVPEGDAADVVRQADAGWVEDPRDVEALATRLAELARAKQNGTLRIDPDDEVIARYERRNQAQQLSGILNALTARCTVAETV